MIKLKKGKLRVAAVGDVHFSETDIGRYQEQFREISQHADVLVICGDLTMHGLSREAATLTEELKHCEVPVVGVLGNHDYDHDEQDEIREVVRPVMALLDEEPQVINGVGFAGVKGFGGGFGRHILAAFGESSIKNFVQTAVEESLRLEKAIKQLDTDKKVVVLHYSPVADTLRGESLEIHPFMGTSRLAEPIDLLGVDLVLHGHAHHGSPKGKTPGGVPVHNVALTQLKDPNEPYLLVEV